jgi:hypothetical protein
MTIIGAWFQLRPMGEWYHHMAGVSEPEPLFETVEEANEYA